MNTIKLNTKTINVGDNVRYNGVPMFIGSDYEVTEMVGDKAIITIQYLDSTKTYTVDANKLTKVGA